MRFWRRQMRLAPRRVMARSPLWVSVTRSPVVRRVNQVAAWSSKRRDGDAELLLFLQGDAEVATAKHEIGALRVQRIDQPGDVGDAMLPVAVEGDDEIGALAQRILDAGLQAGALPQIDRMLDQGGAGLGGDPGGRVPRPVVDDDHPVTGAQEIADHGSDHPRLVIGGDDDPDSVARRGLHCSSSDEKETTQDQPDTNNEPY